MNLAPGVRLGHYEIVARLGAGGMGEVFRARDTKLGRDVALKLLPDSLAGDADRLARFTREAQILATLNHPNIAQIHGVEDAASAAPALVMELVTGRTLDEVIRAGPTPWSEALPMARQIAEALECAHESGIVHRDLKPANVKVRDDGTVKVLDFGLAVARTVAGTASGSGSGLGSPTITSPAMTEMGVILGTAAYMSPEQARGRPVDKRADIWAYGVVLFELVTGRSLFAGTSLTETIAAVIKDEPDLDQLPADMPPAVRRLIARCLERDPARRLRDIGEARILLSGPLDVQAPPGAGRTTVRRATWLAAGAAAVALVLLSAAAASWITPAPLPLRRFELALPHGVADYAISNDGSRLAWLAGNRLYVRRFDELEATDLGGMHVTAGQLLWSPDDRTIAFTAEGRLRSIPADGGPFFDIAQIPASGTVMDAAWLANGTIVFSVWRDSIYAVPATGGQPVVQLTVDPEREIDFHHLAALPGDRLIVATHRREEDSDVIELVELGGGRRRVLLTDDPGVSAFEYVAPRRRAVFDRLRASSATLIFRRAATNAGIWAVPFGDGPIDVNSAALVQAGATDYRVARDGTLVAMIPAAARQSLVWVDGSGAESRVPGEEVESPEGGLEISPDGRRAAFAVGRFLSAGGSTGSLTGATVVVRDLETGVDTRLTLGSQEATMWGIVGLPTWFPDGQRLVHRAGRIEGTNLVERRADIAGPARVLAPGVAGRILPDGRTLIFVHDDRGTQRLARAAIGPDGRAGTGEPLFEGAAASNTSDFDVSGDGRLVAFMVRRSNQRTDLLVAPLATPAEQYLVQEGASRPRFTPDGRHLFFIRGAVDAQGQPQGQLVRVSIASAPAILIGPPVVVSRDRPGGPRLGTYDSSDGRRFLMWKPVPSRAGEEQRLILVENGLPAARR